MKLRLFVTALAAVLALTSALAGAGDKTGAWSPAAGLDLLQPGYNLAGSPRQFHLTLIGVHCSPFRVGRFRLPSVGLDFQARTAATHDTNERVWSGHFLFTSGIAYIVEERKKFDDGSARNPERGIHAKAFYDTRKDRDTRIGRWGITVGYFFSF